MKMKHVLKCMLLLAGAIGSSAVMAATDYSGQTINSGSGTLNISGTVTSTSCAVNIDKSEQKFNLNSQDIADAVNAQVLTTPFSTLTFSNCNGQNIEATVRNTGRVLDTWHGNFTPSSSNMADYPDVLRFRVQFQGNGISSNSGVATGPVPVPLDGTSKGLLIKVDSDSYPLKMITSVEKQGDSHSGVGNGSISAEYAYTLTYK